jgi:hypothetical protein
MPDMEIELEIICQNCGSIWAKTFAEDLIGLNFDIVASLKKCPLCYREDVE